MPRNRVGLVSIREMLNNPVSKVIYKDKQSADNEPIKTNAILQAPSNATNPLYKRLLNDLLIMNLTLLFAE